MAPAPLRAWRERDGRLLRLRLSRPKANVLDGELVSALAEAFAAAATPAEDQPALLGILLDAEGPHFSFGASVEEHLPGRFAAMLHGFHALLLRMLDLPIPILVAVRGQCLGGGLELASAGHLLFAAPDAKLGQPEIVLGVFAPGRSVDAAEALRLGLVRAVAEDPEAAALEWFDRHLAKHSASSLGQAVRAARLGMLERVRAKLAALERAYADDLMTTRDAVEGLTAFLEKRPARWEDR